MVQLYTTITVEIELSKIHNEAFDAAVAAFNDVTSELSADMSDYLHEFEKQLCEWTEVTTPTETGDYIAVRQLVGGSYFSLLKKNSTLSERQCTDAIKSLYEPIREKVVNNGYATYSEFINDIEETKRRYMEDDNVYISYIADNRFLDLVN